MTPPRELLRAELRRALPEAATAYLFGSFALGLQRPDSDIDVAVLAPRALDPLRRWQAQEDLAARLGRQVDLVDLRAASTVLAAQVLEHGRVVVDDDPHARAVFEMVTLAEHADLNERRKGILDDVRARGSVYG